MSDEPTILPRLRTPRRVLSQTGQQTEKLIEARAKVDEAQLAAASLKDSIQDLLRKYKFQYLRSQIVLQVSRLRKQAEDERRNGTDTGKIPDNKARYLELKLADIHQYNYAREDR